MRSPPFHLHHGDALAWLPTLEHESVDLIVTDPPYESLEKHRKIGTTTRLSKSKASSNVWFSTIQNHTLPALFEQLYRVLREDRHCYMFCDAETMFFAKPAGFRFWKPLVWDKMKIGMGYHYRARHEFVLFFEKGKRRLNDLSIPDVIQVSRVFNGYPTEKPVGVSEILVRQSTEPDYLVMDPFAGSGSVGVAAMQLGRPFVGADVQADAITLASARMTEAGGACHAGIETNERLNPGNGTNV